MKENWKKKIVTYSEDQINELLRGREIAKKYADACFNITCQQLVKVNTPNQHLAKFLKT